MGSYRQLLGMQKAPERPERVEPVPEHYAGTNFPYRGTETHGVKPDPNVDYSDPEIRYDPEHDGDVNYVPEPVEHDPIPVRIVNENPTEIREFRSARFTVGSPAVQLLGKHDARYRTRIRNTDAVNAIYIGPDSSVNSYTGYKLPAGAEIDGLTTTQEVWATTGDETTADISIMYEFAVRA